ncbi:uncharacterized protein LOC124197711 [Daphnia pulex]|uniref:uncharacterized protein LOC124197711 n=1 Tax=Daphnia pulex TaxID=6669 RepID=UPI001EDCB5B1|nr:uncharacterized protein LOC124197711 [Daphnia pulex]
MVHLLLCSMEVYLSAISEDDNFYFVCLELLKNDLEEKLKLRFEKVEDVPSKALTITYLDPRFKKAYFKRSGSAVENSLDRELRRVKSLRITRENLPKNVPSQISLSPASIFKNLHKETVRKTNEQRRGGENSTVNNILIIKEYNDWPLLDGVDPLQWWKNRQKGGVMLPVVQIVKRYFCIPAISVPSEQIFSKAGLIISKQRNALKPENADMLIFLNKNA